MSQINSNNFFRWFTGDVVDETINFPRLGITDAKIYLPQLATGETVGFYVNADIPFFDADDFTQLQIKATDVNGVVTLVGPVGTLIKVPLASGYRMYASFVLPNLSLGQYQFSIYNLATTTNKCISNYFQVISGADADLYTVSVKWRNSRDAYFYDWSQAPDLYCQLRLNLSLAGYQGEGTVDQTKAVSTGLRRNNNYDIDLSVKLSTYYFDDGANMACYPLFTADDMQLNGRSYLNKTLYVPNVRVVSKVNIGEIELYDQAFSQINKYGQLPAPVISNTSLANTYTILNNSADNLLVSIGVTGGGTTLVKTMAPGDIYQVPITVLSVIKYVTLSYTDVDPLTTIAAIFVTSGASAYSRSTINAVPSTPFGNVLYSDLLIANYFMVFGTINAVRPTAWRGLTGSKTCVIVSGVRNGNSVFTTLQEYYTDDNSATGTQKPNVISDPDYIAPTADPINCPKFIEVSFRSGDTSSVCGSVTTVTGYVPAGQTQYANGTQIFTDNTLTTPMSSGFYADGDSKLNVVTGVVTAVTFCSGGH